MESEEVISNNDSVCVCVCVCENQTYIRYFISKLSNSLKLHCVRALEEGAELGIRNGPYIIVFEEGSCLL